MNLKNIKRLVESSLLEDVNIKHCFRSICEDVEFIPQGDQATEYEVGDVIHTNQFYSRSSKKLVKGRGHRILVVTSKKFKNGVIEYEGLAFSSQIHKSNKNSQFSNNIHIEDDSTIYQSTSRGSSHDSIFLRVDDIAVFTNRDLSTGGVWKGKVSDDFMHFVAQCYDNYKKGKDNSEMHWEVER